MSLFFGLGQSFSPYRAGFPESDHHHVHIVIMSVSCISRQIKIFPDDIFYRFPSGLDITANPPGTGHFFRPGTRISPTANIYRYFVAGHFFNGLTDFCITLLLFQCQLLSGSAIINLDKVESPFIEHQIRILTLVSIKSYIDTVHIIVPDRATGITTGIRIGSCLEAQRMNIIHYTFHSIGKTLRMCMQASRFIAIAKEAIVYIDKTVTHFLQSRSSHGIGLFTYKSLVNIDTIMYSTNSIP